MAATEFVYITEAEVEQRLTMPAVISAVEKAFLELANGRAANVPRFRVQGQGILLHSMSASADYLNIVGWKQYTTTKHGAVFHVGVYERDSGRLKALIEANRLGQLRTGATTGAAAKYLAAETPHVVGLIGTGWQAESQLEAIACVRTISEARVYGRDESRRQEFARKLSHRLPITIRAVASAEQAARDATLIITATSSKQPVLPSQSLSGTQFLAAIGSNWPEKSELEVDTIRQARRVVCDSIAACQREAGELIRAEKAGAFDWERAMELAQFVAQQQTNIAPGLTIFKSVGMALEDLAAAALLL